MLTVALVATAIAAGAHPVVIALAALAVVEPRLVLAGAAGWALFNLVRRRRTSSADVEATFLRALAAEIRAGSSLRLRSPTRLPGYSLISTPPFGLPELGCRWIASQTRSRSSWRTTR